MIGTCERCGRKKVPCSSCEQSQQIICYRCDGDVTDPYCEMDDQGIDTGPNQVSNSGN